MPSPFPGMNPYLELPALWHEFHNRLIVAISDALTPYLQPRYYVAVETRTYSRFQVSGVHARASASDITGCYCTSSS